MARPATAPPTSPTPRNQQHEKLPAPFEKALRNTIETQTYTAVVIALGLGWLFGRMHRPL